MTDLNRILRLPPTGDNAIVGELRLPNPAWAWEYLRRNANYRNDYLIAKDAGLPATDLQAGCHIIREQRRWLEAEKWGLLTFTDPDQCSIEANVFWLPETLAGALNIKLHPLGNGSAQSETNQDEIILTNIQAKRVILETIDGANHILMNGEKFWIQLLCKTPVPIEQGVRIGVEIEGTKHFQRRLDTAAQLVALYQSSGKELSLIGRTKNASRLTYGLVALDIIAAGGSHKDVANCILGAQKVEQEWGASGHYLEDWTRKLIGRANALVDGGYRSFLTKKSL